MSKLFSFELKRMLVNSIISAFKENLYHFRLDQRLQSINLAVSFPLHKPNLTKGSFADDLDCSKVADVFPSS